MDLHTHLTAGRHDQPISAAGANPAVLHKDGIYQSPTSTEVIAGPSAIDLGVDEIVVIAVVHDPVAARPRANSYVVKIVFVGYVPDLQAYVHRGHLHRSDVIVVRGVYYNSGIIQPHRTYRYVANAIAVKCGYPRATGVIIEQPTAADKVIGLDKGRSGRVLFEVCQDQSI